MSLYVPGDVRLNKLTSSAQVGWTMRLGESRLGQTSDEREEIALSAISLTDGYNQGENGELSIDPTTGTASITETFRPGVSDTVISKISPPILPGERFETVYGDATITQGSVLKISATMRAKLNRWVRTYNYTLTGVAGSMLDNTTSWDFLDEEPALTRLRRFFTVDTDLLTPAMLSWLGTVMVPGRDFGSSTYLDLAREFSFETRFPVRPKSVFPSRWDELEVVPAVNFYGSTPVPVMGDAEEWSGAAEFEIDAKNIVKPVSISVKKNWTGFLGGFNSVPMSGDRLGGFHLGASRIGDDFTIPVGFQTPSIVDVFGTPLVVSKIQHHFTSRNYRSEIEVVAPMSINDSTLEETP